MTYYVIATGYNCAVLARKFINSANRIKFDGNYKIILCSDGSTDGTHKVVQEAADTWERFEAQVTEENMGAAYQRHRAIKTFVKNEEDVVIFIGLDDEIFPDALDHISTEYDNGKWMTYGNWIDEKHGTLQKQGFDITFKDEVHRDRSYRKDVYRSTGLNTFKRFLYDQIPEADLQVDGKWINTTTESEVMFSCLEMCGRDRIGVIFKPIALYNRFLPKRSLNRLGDKYGNNIGREYKYQVLDIIKSRPKRELLER